MLEQGKYMYLRLDCIISQPKVDEIRINGLLPFPISHSSVRTHAYLCLSLRYFITIKSSECFLREFCLGRRVPYIVSLPLFLRRLTMITHLSVLHWY